MPRYVPCCHSLRFYRLKYFSRPLNPLPPISVPKCPTPTPFSASSLCPRNFVICVRQLICPFLTSEVTWSLPLEAFIITSLCMQTSFINCITSDLLVHTRTWAVTGDAVLKYGTHAQSKIWNTVLNFVFHIWAVLYHKEPKPFQMPLQRSLTPVNTSTRNAPHKWNSHRTKWRS